LRKAERAGLVANWEDPVRFAKAFGEIYRVGMDRIGATRFYLFGDRYFEALMAIPYARVLVVREDSEVLATGIFLFGPSIVEYHLSATTPKGRALGATNLLIHEAGKQGKLEGRRLLYLGGGTDRTLENPLLRFKESFSSATRHFHIGYRVMDPASYERLRAVYPEKAANTGRVLFYRDE